MNEPVPSGQYHLVMFLGEQQDPAHVGFVVVKRMQLGRSHVKRSVCRKTVVQSVIERQQVHVVHGQVVGVVATLQEADVDQRRAVKSETRTETTSFARVWLRV